MAKKADQCTDEYSIDDYGATWICTRQKGHVGWHSSMSEETEAVWIMGILKGQKKVMVETRWRRGEIERYDPKTDTFK